MSSKKKIRFMCTAFRDGFQSVYGARVFTKDFMPAVAAAREAGITHSRQVVELDSSLSTSIQTKTLST